MKRLTPVFGLLFVLICFAFNAPESGLPKSAWKKIEKEWSKQWPDQVIEKRLIKIEEVHFANSELKHDDNSLYGLYTNGALQGYMMLSKAASRYDVFDFMVLYNPDLSIRSSRILIYREDWGGEIGSVRWLKQFIGLTANDAIKIDSDIQGISGATISCQSATHGIKHITDFMAYLQMEEQLN